MASSRRSSNGPDWTDVLMAMKAVAEFHSVNIVLSITPAPANTGGDLRLTAEATRKMNARGALPGKVSRSLTIGSSDHEQVAASGFRLMYDLDLGCGKLWAHTELFESV